MPGTAWSRRFWQSVGLPVTLLVDGGDTHVGTSNVAVEAGRQAIVIAGTERAVDDIAARPAATSVAARSLDHCWSCRPSNRRGRSAGSSPSVAEN